MDINQEDEIDLKELFFAIKSKIWIVILSGLLAALGMGLYTSKVIEPVYTSSAMLYIVNRTSTLTSLSDLQLGAQLTKDYKILITSRPVTAQVITDLGLNLSHEQLVDKITVGNPADTRILTISVVDSDPYRAKSIVDELTKTASQQISKIMTSEPPRVVEEGNVPTEKTSPNISKNILLGGIAGTFFSSTLISIIFILNDTVKNSEDVEKYLNLNTLASIPMFEKNPFGKKIRKKRN